MRLLSITSCRPGMRLGKSIFNEEGLILLRSDIELTQSIIKRLEQYGMQHVYIKDARTEDIIIPDMISERTKVKAVTAIRSHFDRLKEPNSNKGMKQPYLGRDFHNVMSMILEDLSEHNVAMIMLMNMNVTDQYLYQHSLNVCIYASMLGTAYGYSKDQLVALGLGALLHDIGKTKIPLNLLRKSEKLTNDEYEQMKKHAEIGYMMLKDEPNIPLLSAHCAFQHHERLCGSGYPRGIEGNEIHEYAQWIGIVDSYDAMTSHRVYRPAMLPHQALKVITAGEGTLYDKEKVALFRNKVALYPLGITVGLSTGETAVVVDINASLSQRPIVRVLTDHEGQDLAVPYEIDLSKQLTVMITSVNDIKV